MGVIGMSLFFIALLIAGWLPIPGPSLGISEVAEMYQSKTNAIRICGVVMMISAMFTAPFYAVVSIQLRRMEGQARPVMSYAQLCAGAAGMWTFALPGLFFIITAFRPERSVEITHTLNDIAWIMTAMPWPMAAMQALTVAITILKYHEAQPIFPRWVMYFNLWIAILLVPGSLIPFFKTGPFAWNGILTFYIPATVFALWYIIMQLAVFKALKTENG